MKTTENIIIFPINNIFPDENVFKEASFKSAGTLQTKECWV
jgi:hypothetical protein